MIEKLAPFMTVEQAIEALIHVDDVPDHQLKLEIVTLVLNGCPEKDIWDYINSHND